MSVAQEDLDEKPVIVNREESHSDKIEEGEKNRKDQENKPTKMSTKRKRSSSSTSSSYLSNEEKSQMDLSKFLEMQEKDMLDRIVKVIKLELVDYDDDKEVKLEPATEGDSNSITYTENIPLKEERVKDEIMTDQDRSRKRKRSHKKKKKAKKGKSQKKKKKIEDDDGSGKSYHKDCHGSRDKGTLYSDRLLLQKTSSYRSREKRLRSDDKYDNDKDGSSSTNKYNGTFYSNSLEMSSSRDQKRRRPEDKSDNDSNRAMGTLYSDRLDRGRSSYKGESRSSKDECDHDRSCMGALYRDGMLMKASKAREKQFPVSTGQQHHIKNSLACTITNLQTSHPSQSQINCIVSRQLAAIGKLQNNPHDVQALSEIFECSKEIDGWTKRPRRKLCSCYQADAKRDHQLLRADPVFGDVGMHLLRKMGWKFGEGLGKYKTGPLEPIMLEVKLDKEGLSATEEVVKKKKKKSKGVQMQGKHPVSLLNEYASKNRLGEPQYILECKRGPDFFFKVLFNGIEYKPNVTGVSKKEAKANAATVVLKKIGLLA